MRIASAFAEEITIRIHLERTHKKREANLASNRHNHSGNDGIFEVFDHDSRCGIL